MLRGVHLLHPLHPSPRNTTGQDRHVPLVARRRRICSGRADCASGAGSRDPCLLSAFTADALDANSQLNYTTVVLSMIDQLRRAEAATARARGVAAAASARVLPAERAVLAPVQPLLVRLYHEGHVRSKARLIAQREQKRGD